ncbi:MAG: DUF4280 domain-containing protein [Flavobacterium sp.]|nr:MAG: DUF4280 domain-containing protein [Flavobacterium sp.]
MPLQVCMGASMTCSFGVAPSSLIVLPQNRVMTSNMPAANIMDNKPLVNIPSFGMCSSMANPQVAAATNAAMGALTPMPCVPATVTPWAPGSPTVLLGGVPTLSSSCSLNCMWGGVIRLDTAGQVQVTVP